MITVSLFDATGKKALRRVDLASFPTGETDVLVFKANGTTELYVPKGPDSLEYRRARITDVDLSTK